MKAVVTVNGVQVGTVYSSHTTESDGSQKNALSAIELTTFTNKLKTQEPQNPDPDIDTDTDIGTNMDTNTDTALDTSSASVPKTGDDSNMNLWLLLMASSFVGMAVLLFYIRRKRGNSRHKIK